MPHFILLCKQICTRSWRRFAADGLNLRPFEHQRRFLDESLSIKYSCIDNGGGIIFGSILFPTAAGWENGKNQDDYN